MRVNFLDLRKQYLSIKPEIDKAIEAVFEETAFSGGKFVENFEQKFAEAHQVKHCIAVNNGTSALHALLFALGIGPGDEVIVPVNTFFATPQAVSLCGAIPVFVDCTDTSYNIDPSKVTERIRPQTKAVFAVHLYGQPAALRELKEICDRHNLLLLEDCAQAHLAEFEGQPIGAYGKAGCFSFYPGKNLGAFGEGGAIITNDDALAAALCKIRNHGSTKKYYHDQIGHNYRMAGLQGAILDVKMDHISNWTDIRRERARRYGEQLDGISQLITPAADPDKKHVYHLYVVRAERRNDLQEFLMNKNVYTGLHYPVPCHLQGAYKNLKYQEGDFPIAEKLSGEILSLPMSDQLTEEEVDYVCECIREFYKA